MKETVTLIGIIAFAVSLWILTMSLWFLRGQSDKKIIDSNNATIKSLQNTIQAKEDVSAKDKALLDAGNATIKSLQNTIQANADKQKALLDAKDDSIKSLQNDAKTKDDEIAKDKAGLDAKDETIKSLQDTIQTKDDLIAKDNALIASFQGQGNDAGGNEDTIIERIYPKDNGFDAQDLGAGFNALQVFGPVNNPTHVPIPDKVPNHTPWKFGNGNSGIAANGSGFYVTGATNGDSNGATSTSGQAGYIQFKGSSISQSVTLPAGTYTVSFDYEGRQNYEPANQIAVSIDGTILFEGAPTDCNNFKQVTSHSIVLTKSGKHELMFRGLGAIGDDSGDHTTFIDNICLNRIDPQKAGPNKGGLGSVFQDPNLTSPPPPPQVNFGAHANEDNIIEKVYPKDNGFDAQDMGSGFSAYQYFGKTIIRVNNVENPYRIPNHTPWTFSGNAGIAANDSGFYVNNAENRDSNGVTSTSGQAGFLQFKDSSISQSVTLSAGIYTITFDYEGRQGYEPANLIAVSIDGKILFEGAPADCNNFQQVTTHSVTLTKSGKHELMFRALGSVGDVSPYPTTFIDNICLNRIDPKKASPKKRDPAVILKDAHLSPMPVPSQANSVMLIFE